MSRPNPCCQNPPTGQSSHSGSATTKPLEPSSFGQQLRSIIGACGQRGWGHSSISRSPLASWPDESKHRPAGHFAPDVFGGPVDPRSLRPFDKGSNHKGLKDPLETSPQQEGVHDRASLHSQVDPDGSVERYGDPLVRVLSVCAPGSIPIVPPLSSSGSTAALDRIAAQLVRKIGLGSSSVHVEFGQGVWAEGKLLVNATDEGVEITLDAPFGVNTSELRQALTRRLERRGIKVSSIDVT